MPNLKISGLFLSSLKVIPHPLGDILHIMKSDSGSYLDIAEVYASCISKNCTKGWKRHLSVPSNIVVISGSVRFDFIDTRNDSFITDTVTLSPHTNHCRLLIPPLVWVRFTGLELNSILINCASALHDPLEQENIPLSTFNFP